LALPPINTTDDVFVREVNEELQRDELLSLWDRYGKKTLGVIGLLLTGWAGLLLWNNHQAKAYGLQGEKLTEVVDLLQSNSDPKTGEKLQEIVKSDATGFHAPAGMILGGIALQKGDPKKAIAAFSGVVADQNAAQPWRDLALIRQTAAELDSLKPDAIVARLKPLAIAGKPWFGSAGEMLAITYLNMKKPELAGKLFADMAKDEKVPESIRNRSSEMANALGVPSTPPAAKEGTP
jgi:hypothetical protein